VECNGFSVLLFFPLILASQVWALLLTTAHLSMSLSPQILCTVLNPLLKA